MYRKRGPEEIVLSGFGGEEKAEFYILKLGFSNLVISWVSRDLSYLLKLKVVCGDMGFPRTNID